ncbi:MAG: type II toxin-antitoxin system HicA family toxin [Coriobacteriia bacterium]|nr:type II toxin-antitoxin system HicA family toxin [Coriobacteriia bacterium]
MKKRDLIKKLRQGECQKIRDDGKHESWTNGKIIVAVPRHNEIKEGTAKQILKDLGLK